MKNNIVINNLKICYSSKLYYIKILSRDDICKIQQLCEACEDYYNLVEGMPANMDEGKNILYSLPVNKGLEDKVVLGVVNEEDRIIAVLDIIKGYKIEGEWTIGLFLLDPSERGKGLGEKIHKTIVDWLIQHKVKKLRIGVVRNNIKAYKFWQRVGYKEIDRIEMNIKDINHEVIVMEKMLNG